MTESRREYSDGDYFWPTMYGTYAVPMLLLLPGVNKSRIMFFDEATGNYEGNYEVRYVYNHEVDLADAPAGWQGTLFQGAGVQG